MPPSDSTERTGQLPPFVVAMTGGIGSGKSTVARILEDLGAHRMDADEEARSVLQEKSVIDRLAQRFGSEILSSPGEIDREALSKIVFSDPEALHFLESVVHPAVRDRIDVALEKLAGMGFDSSSPFPDGRIWILLDIPLLETSPYRTKVDRILFVEAPEEDRESRVRENRGWAAGERARREDAQLPINDKRAGATHSIENSNNTTPEELKIRCQELIQQWISEMK
ncbi:MAG: dephospho-CoA kinase [Planctomycetes bacterium]|nr:dephospho-CoA kinase [Planctomycetota bacterium]